VGGFQDAITFGFAEGKVGQSGFEGAVVIFLDRGHGCVVQREQAVEAGGEAGDDIGRITGAAAGFARREGKNDEEAALVERLAGAHLSPELVMLVEEADGLAMSGSWARFVHDSQIASAQAGTFMSK
jgi:hypothetical protein